MIEGVKRIKAYVLPMNNFLDDSQQKTESVSLFVCELASID
jgi:hypothetical protein